MIAVAHGDFARDDVRQRVDKSCRTGETGLAVADCLFEEHVGQTRARTTEQHHGTVVTFLEAWLSLGLEQQFRGHEAQSAEHIHLKEAGIVTDFIVVEFCQQCFATTFNSPFHSVYHDLIVGDMHRV